MSSTNKNLTGINPHRYFKPKFVNQSQKTPQERQSEIEILKTAFFAGGGKINRIKRGSTGIATDAKKKGAISDKPTYNPYPVTAVPPKKKADSEESLIDQIKKYLRQDPEGLIYERVDNPGSYTITPNPKFNISPFGEEVVHKLLEEGVIWVDSVGWYRSKRRT